MKEELLLLRKQLKMGHRISFAEAMLLQRAIDILVSKAGNLPVNDVTAGKLFTKGDVVTAESLTTINPAPDLVSLQKKAESIIGNYPGIPDGSEHCPCCGKKLRRACSVEGCGGKHVAHGLCQKHYDMKRWEDPEQVERFREAGRRYREKKKSTEATPQEPKP
ncbi:hypothetical protein C3378_24795 [Klebsiella michiganensis]|uniref:hypothetical protein n=1 Tax=Klebsiella michiganensis TaxID=1134687 RepID=UPI000CDDAC1C|nr:hypothetical protein [Klebsiella michiganensis]POT69437.1 hypothetical protein C3378_24795 [Klebsiella michiganensis]